MKETTPTAMPPCFDKWCHRFDDVFGHKAQKREFRHYLGGLLGESERKNLSQLANNALGVDYHRLHHFLTAAPWSESALNERRLQVMDQCRQTRIARGFSLIVDDSGHRKSGNFTDGVGRQYIGEIGKTENGVVYLSILCLYIHPVASANRGFKTQMVKPTFEYIYRSIGSF